MIAIGMSLDDILKALYFPGFYKLEKPAAGTVLNPETTIDKNPAVTGKMNENSVAIAARENVNL